MFACAPSGEATPGSGAPTPVDATPRDPFQEKARRLAPLALPVHGVMSQRRRLLQISASAVALLALASAGCGSGSGSSSAQPLVGRAFQSRAAAVCRAALAQKRAQGPFPYPNFNPTN